MKKNTSNGFTLLETLVAIGMLTVVISAVMVLVQNSLQANMYAKDQITAKYLAEEGVEYIRNIRDQNVVEGAAKWLDNVAQGAGVCGDLKSSSTNQKCSISAFLAGTANSIPANCGVTACPALHMDPTTGRYDYTSSFITKFTRNITVTGVDGRDVNDDTKAYSALVHVTITWNEGTVAQTYTVDDYLFKWY